MKKKRIIGVFIIICVIIMIYSIVNIALWYIGIKRNREINEEIHEIIDDDNTIDFAKLKEKNSDIVGYLRVNNTNIDYIVVKGNDNKFYLRHNLYKEYSHPGWIFMDYHNKLDGNDRNIVIYGHNNKEGSMFGSLKNVLEKEWYENSNNHIINLVLEDKTLTYQVFSSYSINVEDYYINTSFKSKNDFKKFIQTLKNRSVYDYGVEIDDVDSILTLSTCTGNGKKRVALHAKLLNNNLLP